MFQSYLSKTHLEVPNTDFFSCENVTIKMSQCQVNYKVFSLVSPKSLNLLSIDIYVDNRNRDVDFYVQGQN